MFKKLERWTGEAVILKEKKEERGRERSGGSGDGVLILKSIFFL